MSLKLITLPAVEPVTLAEVKLQCGYDPKEDADPVKERILAKRLRGFAQVARAKCEDEMRRVLISQTWKWTFAEWPRSGPVMVPNPPLVSISSFGYVDCAGTLQDIAETCYRLDAGDDTAPGALHPVRGEAWTSFWQLAQRYEMTYVAGYGESGAAVPLPIRQAILFLAQFYDENGGATDQPIPRVVRDLIAPYVNRIS